MSLKRAVLLSVALVFFACAEDKSKKRSEMPPASVTTTKAERRDFPVFLHQLGRAEAYESVVIRSRIEGQVQKVFFTEGALVKKGDLLMSLDAADFSARARQALANADKDRALAEKAKTDLSRYTVLREKNFISEEKLNDIRTTRAATKAAKESSEAAAHLANLQLSYTKILAPFDGQIGARLVSPGASVRPNDTNLALLNRVSPLLISFALPERYLPALREARKRAQTPLKIWVSAPSTPEEKWEAEVHFLDNAVEPASGTILVKARLKNEAAYFSPGQFLNVALLLTTLKNTVVVPDLAIQQGQNGNFVFVVKNDIASMKKVSVAASEAGFSAISEGLVENEVVVTDGHLRLSPGAKVRDMTKSQTSDGPTSQEEKKPRDEMPAKADTSQLK